MLSLQHMAKLVSKNEMSISTWPESLTREEEEFYADMDLWEVKYGAKQRDCSEEEVEAMIGHPLWGLF